MAQVPHPYTAEDGVKWVEYAEAFTTYLNRTGPHPGAPPPGYMDVYRARQQ